MIDIKNIKLYDNDDKYKYFKFGLKKYVGKVIVFTHPVQIDPHHVEKEFKDECLNIDSTVKIPGQLITNSPKLQFWWNVGCIYHQDEPKPPKPSTPSLLKLCLVFYHETKFEPIFIILSFLVYSIVKVPKQLNLMMKPAFNCMPCHIPYVV